MSFEISRLRGGDRMIAIGALALFIFMFFFKWFGVEVPAIVSAFVAASHVSTSANAWHTLEVIRWLLFVTVLVSSAWVVLQGLGRKFDLPVSLSAIVAGLGALCALLVFYRVLISHPFPHAQVKIGAWLGLISCAVIAYGGYRAMSDEGTTLADVREQARASFDSVTTAAGGDASSEGEAPSHT
ncbi:MAG TPA: hypothetical protein VGY76_06215 [Solirubrobacteraceae bacterium]|jgi:hypothetical protein|nr:hypothetical protein [Solirubrobacteraceae bacterium]